jgi:surfactin family lipopeptide synthetase A
LARREGATLFTAVLGGLLTLLQNYTHQEDIIVGTLAPAGRKHAEFRRTMGYFLNPVALRADLSGSPTFSSLLRQLRQTTIEAISNDDVPLQMIAERLRLPPDASRSSLFTVALSIAPDVAELPPGWSMTYMDVESGGARWDLYLELSDRANGMLGRAQYNPDLFTRVEINRMLEEFQLRLTEIVPKNH